MQYRMGAWFKGLRWAEVCTVRLQVKGNTLKEASCLKTMGRGAGVTAPKSNGLLFGENGK